MEENNFWSRHRAAVESGLNPEWCLKVAYGCVELDDALGQMDMNQESESDKSVDGIGDDFDYRLKFDDGIPF